jgi:hypothetical protein
MNHAAMMQKPRALHYTRALIPSSRYSRQHSASNAFSIMKIREL